MRQPVAAVVGHREAADAVGGQLGERGVPVGHAVEALRLAVVAEQARLLQQVLVVIEDDRVDIERHAHIACRRGPCAAFQLAGPKSLRLDAGRGEFVGRDRAQHVLSRCRAACAIHDRS